MNQSLERFVEKMIAIRDNDETTNLNWNDLKQVALELGLTEEEWQKVETKFNNHSERGNSFLRYKNYDDAILEYEQALALFPAHADTCFSLASTHALRWRNSGNADDKKMALRYCDDTLKSAPTHEQAIKLLSELKVQKQANKQLANKKSKKYLIIALTLLLAALLVVGFSLLRSYPTPKTDLDMGLPTEKTEVIEPITMVAEPVAEGKFRLFDEWTIPVKFINNKRSANIDFIIEKSAFDDYDNSFAYKFTGYIGAKQNIEISKLELTFELIGKNGKVLYTDTKDAIPEHEPVHRIGDLAAVDFLEYEDNTKMPDFKEVHISVSKLLSEPAGAEYSPSPQKDFTWANGKPNNIDLELRERMNQTSSSYNNGLTHEVVLEFKNTGNKNIENLQFKITWWDKNGKVVDSEEVYATISSYSKIRRGQTRLYGRTWIKSAIKPENFEKYTIEIVAAK